MMWKYKIETLQSPRVQQYTLFSEQQQLTYLEVIKLWQDNTDFCSYFNSLLRESPFSAYFWETPPVTLNTVERKFKFVLIDNPKLSKLNPNPNPFKKYFTTASREQTVITFPNLRQDAMLVVPRPNKNNCNSTYTHIANFVRKADSFQQQELWQTVGKTLQQNLSQQPIWVSTSGLGVYWLHIRLDSIPKYYFFQPYKTDFI